MSRQSRTSQVDPPDVADEAIPAWSRGRERTVTASQVQRAVTQLRERTGLSDAEQMPAVLRALGLVVVADHVVPEPRQPVLEDLPGPQRPR